MIETENTEAEETQPAQNEDAASAETAEAVDAADAVDASDDDFDVDVDADEEEEEAVPAREYSGRRIMCFVSKKMVAIEDTVEVEYSPGVPYRVHERFIHV
jgi:hypothetical protein